MQTRHAPRLLRPPAVLHAQTMCQKEGKEHAPHLLRPGVALRLCRARAAKVANLPREEDRGGSDMR